MKLNLIFDTWSADTTDDFNAPIMMLNEPSYWCRQAEFDNIFVLNRRWLKTYAMKHF